MIGCRPCAASGQRRPAAPSVRVGVMLVRHVRVGMADRNVPVRMAVDTCRHLAVGVCVMQVVVAVRVLVLECFVQVFVPVALVQV